jgi:4-hydroxy-tetrahydrodipicolinate reductase
MAKVKVAIVGARGRMGTRIGELCGNDAQIEAVARLDTDTTPSGMKPCHVVIDFSQPEGSLIHLAEAVKQKKAYVLGTTGFSKEQETKIKSASRKISVVRSSNMSLGVNVFFTAAQLLAKALPGYSVHIQETHHIHKKDSPSGTALQAGSLIEKVSQAKVTYESIREGEVIGDHRVILTGPSDKIELSHHADSRDIFAAGAIAAAKWVVRKKPGLYTMRDVLGL